MLGVRHEPTPLVAADRDLVDPKGFGQVLLAHPPPKAEIPQLVSEALGRDQSVVGVLALGKLFFGLGAEVSRNAPDDSRIERRCAALKPEKRVAADPARSGQCFERESPAAP